MKKTVGFCEFQDAFTNCGRGESFTYDGFKALYDYLTQLEDGWIEIELDPIAFDCEYTEYDSAIEAVDEYTEDIPYLLDEDEMDGIDTEELMEKQNEKALEYLNDRTQVIHMDNGGIIIANF